MSKSTGAFAVTPVQRELAERAVSLGAFCWHANAAGEVVHGPDAPNALKQWLRSPRIHETVAAAARLNSDASPREVFAGCHIFSLTESVASRRVGASVMIVLNLAATDGAAFADLCASASIDAASVITELKSWLAGRNPDPVEIAKVLGWSLKDLTRSQADAATLDQFSEKLIQSYEETNLLFRLARFMNGVSDPEQIMHMICNQLQQAMPFSWLGIRFADDCQSVPDLANELLLAGTPPCSVERIDAELSELLHRSGADNWTRLLLPERDALAQLVGSEVVVDPIAHDGKVIGVLVGGNKTGDDADASSVEMQFLDAAADFLGVFHENLARFTEQRKLFLGTLHALTASIDAKDRYTCGHSERVALLASKMASAMALDRKTVEEYRIAGMVHDVGKIGVPEAVLCKGGRLTDEEFAFIRQHPEIGHRILKDIPLMKPQLPGVLHHHERWDGRGYPHGLAGESIPMIARVLTLADTFDAMSSNRAYRPAQPRERVLTEIARCGGSQFDPALAPVFIKLEFTDYDRMLAGHHAQSVHAA